MLGVTPVRYISIDIDVKTYNRVIRFITVGEGKSDIKVNKFFIKRLEQPNEFIRLKCGEYYMDIKLKSFKPINNIIIICFGELIDCNKGSYIHKNQIK